MVQACLLFLLDCVMSLTLRQLTSLNRAFMDKSVYLNFSKVVSNINSDVITVIFTVHVYIHKYLHTYIAIIYVVLVPHISRVPRFSLAHVKTFQQVDWLHQIAPGVHVEIGLTGIPPRVYSCHCDTLCLSVYVGVLCS